MKEDTKEGMKIFGLIVCLVICGTFVVVLLVSIMKDVAREARPECPPCECADEEGLDG
jgi:hypothetical protein